MLNDAFKYYYTATTLKDSLREGAVQWQVNKERKESIAEHTFGCLILATALYDELKLTLNLDRVLSMLAIHELEEVCIGDITPLSHQDKNDLKQIARQGVESMLSNTQCKTRIMLLTDEYNANITPEARFAKAIDKLECVLEFKKYQDLGQVSLKNLTEDMLQNKLLKNFVDAGKYDLADIFFIYHMPAYSYLGIDENYWFNNLKPLKIK